MVRSAAKNHAFVTIVTDPADYDALSRTELARKDGATSCAFRKRMAAKAYAATADYDAMIASWFALRRSGRDVPRRIAVPSASAGDCAMARTRTRRRRSICPPARRSGIAQAEQLQGKELSYNNLNDADAALELVGEFRDGPPTVVIVKHANPCGVAQRRHADRGL